LYVPIAAIIGRCPLQEENRVRARSVAVRMFNGLYRARGWPDFVRVVARTRAGDGYGKGSVSKTTA